MTEYLSEIKGKVDLIAASGSSIPIKDVIYYTLNGLPASYNAFKTLIRTNLHPISLDDLYSLLCSGVKIRTNLTGTRKFSWINDISRSYAWSI